MFDYWISLFQERPMLTMIIIFVALVTIYFVIREFVINILEEASLLRDYLSDDEAAMYGYEELEYLELEEESDVIKE